MISRRASRMQEAGHFAHGPMLDKFIHFTLYISCVFGGVAAMWLTTFVSDEDWPPWVAFVATVALAMGLLRRLGIPFPMGTP